MISVKQNSFFCLFKILFIYLTERSQVCREAERGGSRLPAGQRAQCGARSQDPGIMTRAEDRGFNPLSHPGSPVCVFFLKILFIYLTDRSQLGREAGRERGGSRLPAQQRARCGARSQDSGIMTWTEGRGLTHWATQVPLRLFKIYSLINFGVCIHM